MAHDPGRKKNCINVCLFVVYCVYQYAHIIAPGAFDLQPFNLVKKQYSSIREIGYKTIQVGWYYYGKIRGCFSRFL